MKKFILAALATTIAATSIAATPAMAAPDRGHDNRGRYEQTNRHVDVRKNVVVRRDDRRAPAPQFRNWRKGERFESRYARNYQVIQSPRAYRLHDAPRGYRWVRSGNDAVLVGITTGLIASVLAGVIR